MPFLTVLAPSGRYHGTRDRRPQRLLDRARQALRFVRRWPPWGASGRGRSHKAPEWLDAVRETVCHHARAPIRGALSAASTVEAEAERGPREKGARLPTLVPVADNLVTDWKGLRPPTGRYNGSYALTPMLIRRERFPTIGHSRNVAAGKLSSSAVCSALCMRKLKAKTSNDWSYQIDCPLARWSHNPEREACPL
jgi:hypothetical protein